jgi:hypothetical protein
MLWGVFAGFAFARLFSSPPVANSPAVPRFAPVIQPQPQVMEVQMPQYLAPQSSGSTLTNAALGAAVVAAGFVAGRQAMLFTSKSTSTPKKEPVGRVAAKKPAPKPKAAPKRPAMLPFDVQDRPKNRGGPYATNKKNIMTQKSGFGTFVQKFQLSEGKSKYGVPIYLDSGNINPAYLAAERKELAQRQKLNTTAAEKKRKGLIAAREYDLADYIRKKIGPVGSGKEYYQAGR